MTLPRTWQLREALGAQIGDNMARRITCPACSRPDVWFLIEPDDKKTAILQS